MELSVFAAQQFDHSEANGIGTARRPGGEYAVGLVVGRWSADQLEALGTIEGTNHKQVRKSINVGKAKFKFRQDIQRSFRLMPSSQALGNSSRVQVGTMNKSDWP